MLSTEINEAERIRTTHFMSTKEYKSLFFTTGSAGCSVMDRSRMKTKTVFLLIAIKEVSAIQPYGGDPDATWHTSCLWLP